MKTEIEEVLNALNIKPVNPAGSTGLVDFKGSGKEIASYSPVDGNLIASVGSCGADDYETVIVKAQEGFKVWRTWTAPARGEVVRQIGDALREKKDPLGKLVSYEMGKSLQEGLGEVQEMIDICDFAGSNAGEWVPSVATVLNL